MFQVNKTQPVENKQKRRVLSAAILFSDSILITGELSSSSQVLGTLSSFWYSAFAPQNTMAALNTEQTGSDWMVKIYILYQVT